MPRNPGKSVDLLRINYDVGSRCDFCCKDCYRFFSCSLPERSEFYKNSRTMQVAENLSNIKHVIAVMSGKGGVGKSIISANLAASLAKKGYSTAILDSDLHGPSIPSILGVNDRRLKFGNKGIIPVEGPLKVKIVSIGFLLDDDSAVTWLSDLKREAQQLFLAHTDYDYMDYLIIDMPPGTGSEAVNLLKYLQKLSGVLIITEPSDVAGNVVKRCISLCLKAGVPIIGLVENMSNFTCPHCGREYSLNYSSTNTIVKETGIPLLGKISRDPAVVESADRGSPFVSEYPSSKAAKELGSIIDKIEQRMGSRRQETAMQILDEANGYQASEIIEINATSSCYGQNCYHCAKYFQCSLSRKSNLHDKSTYQGIKKAMAGIKHKIAVMSCKGGVGKSTVAANLAIALAQQGKVTTILDCDFHGPCIPKMLGIDGQKLRIGRRGIVPARGYHNLGVVSVDFLIEAEEAVTWFDLLKKVTVEQFLYNVDYGKLDYLIIDLPPGTGGESYSLLQNTPDLDGVIIITVPSENPQAVARKSVTLCRQAGVPVIGIIENMSSFACPACGQVSRICGTKGVRNLARKIHIPFLGAIPYDNDILSSCDEGMPFVIKHPESAAKCSLLRILHKIQKSLE